MIKNILNLGDAAVYCDFGKEVNQNINQNVIKYFKNIKNKNIEGITNITPSYNKLIVSFDLTVTNFSKIKNLIENLSIEETSKASNKLIKIPVCCEDNFKLDHTRLEKILNLKFNKILENFFDKEYFCYMTGFIAGMPFLGDLKENLRAKRLETPRVKVPAGSIGILQALIAQHAIIKPITRLPPSPIKILAGGLLYNQNANRADNPAHARVQSKSLPLI